MWFFDGLLHSLPTVLSTNILALLHSTLHEAYFQLSSHSQVLRLLSRVRLFMTHGLLHARPACPSPTPGVYSNSCLELVMPFSHLIFCRPLLLSPSIFPSIKVFSSESALRIRWPKYWSFSFNISPSNEHLGLISLWIDWLDLLAVQRTLKSLL